MSNIRDRSLFISKLPQLVLKPLIHLLAPCFFKCKLLFELFNQTLLLYESLSDHGVDFLLSFGMLDHTFDCALGFNLVECVQIT